MRFPIYPRLELKYYKIIVEYCGITGDVERFKVYGKSIIVIESNRPKLRRLGLKRRQPAYKMVERNYNAELYFNSLVAEIKKWVTENLDKQTIR